MKIINKEFNTIELTKNEKKEINGGKSSGNPFYDFGHWLGELWGDYATGLGHSYGYGL